MPTDSASDRPVRFEDAIAELEAIIERIESGSCGLEECIAQYERGMKLVGSCQSILNVVQQRIVELTADQTGRLQVRDAGAAGAGAADAAGDDADAVEGELDDAPPPTSSGDGLPRRAGGGSAPQGRPRADPRRGGE